VKLTLILACMLMQRLTTDDPNFGSLTPPDMVLGIHGTKGIAPLRRTVEPDSMTEEVMQDTHRVTLANNKP
jgi:hypothetical protein